MTEVQSHASLLASWQSVYSFESSASSCCFFLGEMGLPSVRWNPKLIDWLLEEMVRSPGTDGLAGEVGGVLLGTISGRPNRRRPDAEVRVSWFLPLPLEGLVSSEKETLERIAAATRRNLTVVGIYKSQQNSGSGLSAEDRTLAATFLTNPHQIFLLIHPNDVPSRTAEIFFPRVANHPETRAVIFPFNRELLSSHNLDQQREPHASGSRRHKGRLSRTAAIGFVLACVLAVAVYFTVRSRDGNVVKRADLIKPAAPETHRASQSFALSGRAESDHVKLTWDPQTSAVAAAYSGSLAVEDGTFTNRIQLDKATLQKGSVVYYPLTANVRFRLRIGSSVGQVAVEAAPRVKPDRKVISASAAVAPKPRIFTMAENPPRRVQTPMEVAAIPLPPSVPQAGSARPVLLDLVASPPAQPPSVPPGRVTYTAPQSEIKVFPQMPASISRLLTSPITIRVKVSVDRQGGVSGAVSLNQAGTVEKALSQVAEKAALLWHFSPARRNGVATSSETVLEFRFSSPH